MKDVGKRIQRIRIERGYTLQELGDKINFNYSNLSKIERGVRTASIELIESLAKFFDVPISYFFGETIEVPQELKERDVEWIAFNEEMEKRGLTPDELKKIVDFIDSLNKN